MIWIFLSVVVALAVFHEGFRKFVYWAAVPAIVIAYIVANQG
jgi:uncharacterized membrane protein